MESRVATKREGIALLHRHYTKSHTQLRKEVVVACVPLK